ncbi:MAG: MazG-like family protein [Halalkalicoccus sp.]|nr:MazG-like family protein [Halalkalicoccus sp.]
MDRVREFNAEYGLELDPEHRLLDPERETGELAKELLKASEYGEREVETTDELEDEFGTSITRCSRWQRSAGSTPRRRSNRA